VAVTREGPDFGQLRDYLDTFVFFCGQAAAVEEFRIEREFQSARDDRERLSTEAIDVHRALAQLGTPGLSGISYTLEDQADIVLELWRNLLRNA
jgi:hypothetical protein